MRYLRLIPLVAFLFAGTVKALPVFRALPIDFTLLAGVIVAAQVAAAVVRRPPPHRVLLPVLAVFATFTLGILTASAGGYTDPKITYLFTLTLLGAVAPICLIRTRRALQRLVLLSAGLGAAVCALAIRGDLEDDNAELLLTPGSNTIGLGRVAGVTFVVMVVQQMHRSREGIVVRLGVAAVAMWTMLNTTGQGPLLAVGLTLLAVVMLPAAVSLGRRRGERTGRVVAALGTVGILAVAWRFTDAVRLSSLGAVSGESTRVRAALLGDAARTFLDHPLGVGWGDLGELIQSPFPADVAVYPHNMWVEVASEAGIVAGVTLVAVTVLALVVSRKGPQDEPGQTVAALFLYWCVNVAVSGDVNDRVFFALLGLALLAPRLRWPKTAERQSAAADAVRAPRAAGLSA